MSEKKTAAESPATTKDSETETGFGVYFSHIFPGKIGSEVITFVRAVYAICIVILGMLTLANFGLHYLLLTGIAVAIAVCFEHFIFELSKTPEVKPPESDKPKKD